jgi:hypothetical protein
MARGLHRYNPPPNWPTPPPGWTPPRGWFPDPAWPPPPAGWEFWLPVQLAEDSTTAAGATTRSVVPRLLAGAALVVTLVVAAMVGLAAYLVTLGLVAVAVGVVAIIRASTRTTWLGNRWAGIAVLVAGLVCLLAAGVLAESPPPSAAARQSPTSPRALAPSNAASPSPRPTPRPSAAPTAVATPSPTPRTSPKATPKAAPKVGTALAAAAALTVKGRAAKTGYDRDNFGSGWTDVDRNGCDTRNDVLRRDLDPVTVRAGTQGCLVVSGTLADPYTGTRIAFTRGQTTSNAVQIDHVVALSDSWQKGAQGWSRDKREAFANDPLNLLAVQGSANMSKGDGDTATWLPSNKAMRCMYVDRQVSVKARYGLWVTGAERDAMERVLRTCPDRLLTTEKQALVRKASSAGVSSAPAPVPAPAPAPGPGSSGTDPRFATCGAAIAAGYGPYYRGVNPEYDWYRDGDGDGKVCER